MYSTTDFRKGLKIEIDATPYEIIDFQHFKPGKGGAMMRTKLRNILNDKVVDKTFRSGEKVDKADLESRSMQYLYTEADNLVFMDFTTYEQIEIPKGNVDGKDDFLTDGQEIKVLLWNSNPIDIEIPISMVLEVTYTETGLKGDTVSNTTKPATLSTGTVVYVPLFVSIGDMVKIDTRTRTYIGRE